MHKPLLSIVVPTKNRYTYLTSLVKLFKLLSLEEVELIIQDNSDDNSEFKEFVRKQICDNIRYFYDDKQMSVCENSDLAILNSNGEYVCFIGDDDGFTREILSCVKYMKENGVDSLVCNKCYYVWPDVHGVIFDFAGTYEKKKYTKKYQEINLKKELAKVLSKGANMLGKLPCVYHGIVRRAILDKVYTITGTFYPGPSPDMGNAIALSLVSSKHMYYNYPVTIAGKGGRSAAGMGAKHQHVGEISKISFLPNGTSENWESNNPKVWTGETIYAESAIKALRNMKREDLISQFNYNALYGNFIAFHFSSRNKIGNFLSIKNILPVIYYTIKSYSIRLNALISNFCIIHHLSYNKKLIDSINDIIECEEDLCNF